MDPRIIQRKLEILSQMAVEESRDISPWQARTADYRGPEEYEYLDEWHDVDDSSLWPALRTVFLRATAEVPEAWEPTRTFMTFAFDAMEGLISIDGQPWAGLDSGHTRAPVPGPGRNEMEIEFIAVPRAWCEPGLRTARGTFSGARLVLIDAELEAAYWDLRFAFETMSALGDGRRKALLAAAIEEAMLAINLAAPRKQVVKEVATARQLLAQRVAEIGIDTEGGRLFLTGHTHIDTAWLWPIRETLRKCSRTFATACRLMEQFPDFHFACSQAQLYDYTKQHYPDLYAQMKDWVAQGRWETTGAMWVEADANVPSGESLIRQILYGLKFFREEFGTRPTVCWLPDVFGYNAGMPQILKGCGLRSFWTWKLHSQAHNEFPYQLFWWQGIDGSRILTHIPKLGGGGYNGNPTPKQLATSWDTCLEKGSYDEQLFPFGYGDGGGGVNEQMMEFAGRAKQYPGLPRCRQGTVEQFFADVHQAGPELPTWVGELYLETHRGTYTTQGRTKQGNRRCELALRDAEIWGTLAACLHTNNADSTRRLRDLSTSLEDSWKKTLLHQFHDILPGSSIGEVYEGTAADHAGVMQQTGAARDAALSSLAGRAASSTRHRVFNSLSWDRDDVVILTLSDVGAEVVAVDDSGRLLPTQVLSHDGSTLEVAVIARGVPSVGAMTVDFRSGESPRTTLQASTRVLESDIYLLELGEDGSLVRLLDKRLEREVIPAGQRANRLQLFQDGPEREAAWNIHATYVGREYPWEGDCSVEIVEQGPVRAVARITREHRETTLVQDIILYAELPRIDFRTQVAWHEKQTLLKAGFPLAVHASSATFEVQFGAYERPTHRNTSWDQEKFEVCALRWADLSESGYGVSLLNDGKYGHDVLANVLRLTLLRGTEYPDPEADQGLHEFTYSLLPHIGDWSEGGTVRQACQLNSPLVAVPTESVEEPTSYISVTGPAILETLKPAEDGDGVILRLYEPHGSRGQVRVKHQLPFAEVISCNLVEENDQAVAASKGEFSLEITPFEIRTFRLHG